jgi:hypothetical protein
MEPEGSSPYTQEPATCPCPELDWSSLRILHLYSLKCNNYAFTSESVNNLEVQTSDMASNAQSIAPTYLINTSIQFCSKLQ